MMKDIPIKGFSIGKLGNSDTENEDAFNFIEAQFEKPEKLLQRLAIADGATMSSFAGKWAQLLVEAYIKEPFNSPEDLQHVIKSLSFQLSEYVESKKPMPWYAEEKARQGAFSTFLGLEFLESKENSDTYGKWQVIGIGDSCLFCIRDNNLLLTFPIKFSTDFNNRPNLVSSNLSCNQNLLETTFLESGNWKTGDIFILATDALAAFLLAENEKESFKWETLTNKKNDTEFKEWVENKRNSEEIKDDDVTYLIAWL